MKNVSDVHGFDFNAVYILSSLKVDERDTASELYNDIIKVRGYQVPELSSYIIDIPDKASFFSELDKIKVECEKGIYPIIHLEMHGNARGIGMRSGEFVSWSELKLVLIDINRACNLNMFISLAVCMGAYLMEIMKPNEPAPFWGIVGSFEKLQNWDLLDRYTGFYDSLLTDFDFNEAVKALYEDNPNLPTDYRFINAEMTFKNVINKYHLEKFGSDEIIRKRFDSGVADVGILFNDENEREEGFKKFSAELLRSKEEYFDRFKKVFFMIDSHPENAIRFPIGFDDVS